jgi:hypothetical protein
MCREGFSVFDLFALFSNHDLVTRRRRSVCIRPWLTSSRGKARHTLVYIVYITCIYTCMHTYIHANSSSSAWRMKRQRSGAQSSSPCRRCGHWSVCLSVCLSLCQHVCLSVYPSVCMSILLSVCLSFCQHVCVSVYLSILLSAYLSFCLSVCLSFCLSVCLSVCLSI